MKLPIRLSFEFMIVGHRLLSSRQTSTIDAALSDKARHGLSHSLIYFGEKEYADFEGH